MPSRSNSGRASQLKPGPSAGRSRTLVLLVTEGDRQDRVLDATPAAGQPANGPGPPGLTAHTPGPSPLTGVITGRASLEIALFAVKYGAGRANVHRSAGREGAALCLPKSWRVRAHVTHGGPLRSGSLFSRWRPFRPEPSSARR